MGDGVVWGNAQSHIGRGEDIVTLSRDNPSEAVPTVTTLRVAKLLPNYPDPVFVTDDTHSTMIQLGCGAWTRGGQT